MLSMKDCARCLSVSMILVACGSTSAGSLTPPPGPVTATMKTLAEVEPRTVLSQANTPGDNDATPCIFKITQPGSYYLAGNLDVPAGKAGIQVEANDVTIDLNGFIIRGVGGTSSAIIDSQDELNQHSRLTVRNGRIDAVGYAVKMDWMGACVAQDVAATGVTGTAFYFNSGGTAERCTAIGAPGASTGFHSDGQGRVEACFASGFLSGFFLDNTNALNCTAANNQNGFLVSDGLVRACSALNSSDKGLDLSGRASVEACSIRGGVIGIRMYNDRNTVRGCTIDGATGKGIVVEYGAHPVIEDNTLIGTGGSSQYGIRLEQYVTKGIVQRNTGVSNGYGIVCVGTDNTVIGNNFGKTPGSNAVYSFASGTRYGPLVKAASGASIGVSSASSSAAGSMSVTDPTANIFY